ncbi:hypothetical protein HN592_00415 [Candidatus Woesearchaeota archaeon]|jgi:hypothetical protein|nr:hypothetical protein [Candidatus Woesearchaeota archaeon]MBT4368770.1 hypothetical protein [Candidatus Woesearchaeota archaeon]MBT4712059.1 hypothetical protein [Candidatus Woesearchaeota archaeon]MBT6639193.1 hypothetical protein [Candidatus Woesearchaeota archaeon]MBT7134393.1 hypothetical protein [Candidatus Woesearchaeota archaeon]
MGALRNVRDHATYVLMGATMFPFALRKPGVRSGNFNQHQIDLGHETLYDNLSDRGFRKEGFQLVYPGQTAGLVKPLCKRGDEVHVRFYENGTLSCEVEEWRLSRGHWDGERSDGSLLLEQEIEQTDLSEDQKLALRSNMSYSEHDFSLTWDNPLFCGFCFKLACAAFVAASIYIEPHLNEWMHPWQVRTLNEYVLPWFTPFINLLNTF